MKKTIEKKVSDYLDKNPTKNHIGDLRLVFPKINETSVKIAITKWNKHPEPEELDFLPDDIMSEQDENEMFADDTDEPVQLKIGRPLLNSNQVTKKMTFDIPGDVLSKFKKATMMSGTTMAQVLRDFAGEWVNKNYDTKWD